MTLGTKVILSLILLTVVSINGQTQDQCARTTNKKTKDILKDFPFNQAKTIKVVSFKKPDNETLEYEIPKINGQVDLSRLFEIKTLNKGQKSKLLDLLVNINYTPITDTNLKNDSLESREIRVNMCYIPRHAILFENEKGQVFSYIEICIECLRHKTYPDNLKTGDFCYEKYKLLEDFFRDIGIVYGVGKNGMNWIED